MKRLNAFFLVVAAVLLAGYLFVRFAMQADIRRHANKNADSSSVVPKDPDSTLDLRPLFIAKIQQLVNEGSKGLYTISIDTMEVDVLNSCVTLQHVLLSHDAKILAALDSSKQAPDDVFKASFDTLRINGINLDDVVNRKIIDVKEIEITGPVVEVYHTKRPYNPAKTVDSVTLFDRIMKNMERIEVGKLRLRKATLVNHNRNKKKSKKLNNVELQLTDILIDSSTEHATDRFLFAKRGFLSIHNYERKTADGVYSVKIGLLTMEAPQQLMTIRNLSLASRYNKQQFQKQLLHQKELYDLKVPLISIRNIDWWAFMNEDHFVADRVDVPGARFKIHLDRSLPKPASKMGNFPHQVVMKLPMKVGINEMNIRNMQFTYEEYNPKSTQTGSIRLDQLKLDISNITNIPQEIKKKKQTIVTGTARFKEVPVKAKFTFDLVNHKSGKFSSTLIIGGFESKIMNDIATPLGLLEIKKGTVKKIDIDVKGDEYHASGNVLMLYNDFKVSLYEKEKDEKGLDKKGIPGFIANTFIIKDDNPTKNNPARNPAAEFQRDPQAGFFNLVWKTTLTGILKTIGANPKLAENK